MGVQPRFLQGWQERSHASSVVPFGGQVARYLEQAAGERRFHCMIVAAHRGDGITTAGDQAEQPARRRVGARAVARLTGDDRPRLAITDLLSPLTVVRAAVRAGVDPGLPVRRRSWLTLLGAAAAFAIAAGLSLLGSAAVDGRLTADETRRVLTNPLYLALAVLAGAAVIVTEPLLHLRSNVTPERLDRIADATTAAQATEPLPPEQAQFITLLATALLDDHSRRCLIVDDYTRLDTVTQSVIRKALELIPADRPELWIVFESAKLSVDPTSPSATLIGDLGRHVLAKRRLNPADPTPTPALGSHATLLYELKHLTDDQRRQLVADAARTGRSANPRYVIIKDILGGDASAAEREAFKQAWPPENVRADIALHDALALLYLLSFNSLPGNAVTFPLKRLPDELTASGAHRELLQRLLRTRPTLYTVRQRLERAVETFTHFVEQDRSTPPAVLLRLSPAIQDVLTPQNGAYGLPGADLVHLFWVLYRFDLDAPDRIKWLEPQTWHLHEAADPSAVGSPRVARTFGAALLKAIDACIDLGRLPAAAELLDQAFDLRAEPDFPLDPAALRKRTRALYAVSANPALLLARPAPDHTTSPNAPNVSTDEPATNDLLIDLFEQATPGVSDLAHLLTTDKPLAADLRLRAIWLALSLQRLTNRNLPRDLPLSRAVVDAHLALPLLTQHALEEADAQLATPSADEWSPAALMSLTTALWCLALADETLTQPILSQIDTGSLSVPRDPALALSSDEWSEWTSTVDIYLADGMEHGLHLARAKPPTEPNYAHSGASSELLVVVVAAAIRIRLRWTSLQRARERRLDAVILDGCRELGIDAPQPAKTIAGRLAPATLRDLAEHVADRMSSIQATWSALGYPSAAAALNTRRVQFLAGIPGGSRRAEAAVPTDRGGNDLSGFIVNLAVAGDTAVHPSVRAEIVAATVGRQLVAGQLDERLAEQLCLLTIQLSSSYDSVDIGRHLRYLVDPPDDGSAAARLDLLLQTIAENELDSTYIHLVNAARWAADSSRDQAGRAHAAVRAMRRRIKNVAAPAVAQALRTRLDTYELLRAINSGHSPDIDATLDAWNDRRTVPEYAFVLYLLIPSQNTPIPDRLRHEATAVLHNPRTYSSETGILLLANEIARAQQARLVATTKTEEADLVSLLRASAHRVNKPSPLPLSEAINTLRHLFRLDPENAWRYRAPLLDLQRNILILLHEQRLDTLLADRQYGDLLREYVRMFPEFLPSTDPGNGQATAFVGSTRRTLNTNFLRDLFTEDDQVRARVDTLTRNALIQVLTLLADIPDMPADMSQLLTQQRLLIQQSDAAL